MKFTSNIVGIHLKTAYKWDVIWSMDFVEKEYFNFISYTFLEFLNSLKTSESNTMVGCFFSQPDLGGKNK